MNAKELNFPPSFHRSGFSRVIAPWLGLASIKSLSFSADGILLNSKRQTAEIDYQNILAIRSAGLIFRSARIATSEKTYAIRGLSSREAKEIISKTLDSEEIAWRTLLFREEREISKITEWIDQICYRSHFQRSSVFKNNMLRAGNLSALFGERLPEKLKETDPALGILKIRDFLKIKNLDRRAVNHEYVEKEIRNQKQLFDTVEKNPLTQEQRKSVVVDEDANLVIASAGSGKTSVIVAKTAWLLNKGLRRPSEILLLAFAKDARKEMSERLIERNSDSDITNVSGHTFHSLGLHIIGQATGEKPSLSILAEDKVQLLNFIKSTIQEGLNDEKLRTLMVTWFGEFFAEYKSEFDFDNHGQYIDYLRKHSIRSIKGEKLKSHEECLIANFLFFNGVEYQYEANYQHRTANSQFRQYKPDFYLPEFDVYIEHLGLKGFGRTAPYVDRKLYLASLRWKRDLHKKHGTTLVETYSCEKEQGVLTDRLRKKLEAVGVQFKPEDPGALFETLSEKGQIDTFTKLTTTFLGHFKGGHLTEEDLIRRASKAKEQDRDMAFIRVFLPIFEAYENYLKDEGAVDFHDMISMATEHIKSGEFENPYRYVMVDEFQDISTGRSQLVKALQDSNPDVQLFCVGDDWQAIFRFAGSDIGIMKAYGEHFGPFERTDLTTAFRSERTIADEATNFILQNDFQILKSVNAIRESDEISIYVGFLDSSNGHRAKLLDEIFRFIVSSEGFKPGSEILVLGRYTLATYLKAYKVEYGKILKELGSRYPDVSIKFLSVHRSKGLEADYVIVLDVISDFLGFPNEMVDDPILNMVLAEPEIFPNSEERRLFYVALTRAKEKVFLLTETGKVSPFINEVIQSPSEVGIFGRQPKTNISCPACIEGVLNLKVGPSGAFWGCSNYPYCECTEQACPHCKKGYPTNVDKDFLVCDICEQTVETCPKCRKGWLQMRAGKHGNFWGCSEYFKTSCGYTRNVKR